MPRKTAHRLRSALGTIAPEIARALGGPLAGSATSALAQALLGRTEAHEDELLGALATAEPATLLRLRQISLEFQKALMDAASEEERIAAADRDSARARERALADRVPGALACVIVAGFFAVLAVMLLRDVPKGAETEFSIMLGALATMAAAVMNYYFGSSASSREKTWLLQGRNLPGDRRGY